MKPLINAKIYNRRDGVHIGPVISRIEEKFSFPNSCPFLHILPATIDNHHHDGWYDFFDSFDLNLKPEDHILVILPFKGTQAMGLP